MNAAISANSNSLFVEFIKTLQDEFSFLKKDLDKYIVDAGGVEYIPISCQLDISEQLIKTIQKLKAETGIAKANTSTQLTGTLTVNNSQNNFDVSNSIKTVLQRKATNFEQEVAEKINKFNKPVIGSFWKEVEKWNEEVSIDCLLETPKMDSIKVTLNPETVDAYLERVKKTFKEYIDADCVYYRDSVNEARETVNGYLVKAGISGKGISSTPTDLSFYAADIIESCVRLDTEYEGSFPKKNLRSMIFETRSLMMMFLLIISTLGINKNPSEIIKNGVFIASIVLLVIGALYTIANNHDLKEEKTAEELIKAKERLLAETKRAANEFIAEWKTKITSTFRNELIELGAEVDLLLKEDAKVKTEAQADKRLKLTQHIQELELKERQYTELMKKAEDWKQQLKPLVKS